MSGFRPLILSFTGTVAMFEKILEALGLSEAEMTLLENADDETKENFIVSKIAEMKGGGEEKPKPEGEQPPAGKLDLSHTSPVILNQLVKGRNAELDSLVRERIITPSHADKLRKSYVSQETLKLDLSHSTDSGETEFDRLVAQLRETAKGRPLNLSGRSGELPGGLDRLERNRDKDSPTVALAKKRAEQSKGNKR
jgi:hypothetical protein